MTLPTRHFAVCLGTLYEESIGFNPEPPVLGVRN